MSKKLIIECATILLTIICCVQPAIALSNANLNGEYTMCQYGTDPNSMTTISDLTCDGNGSVAYQEIASSWGPPYDSGTGTYSVSSDGSLILGSGTGIVSADGNIFTMVDYDASDNALFLWVGIKKSSGMSNAILNGEYTVCQYGTDPNSMTTISDLTCDGNGSVAYQEIASSWGPPYDSGTGTYSVSSDGSLILGSGTGIVSADGNIFTMVDYDVSDNALFLWVGIKKSSGMSNASLNGEYTMCQYGTDPNSMTTISDLTCDGNGSVAYQEIASSWGPPYDSGTGTYSVSSDGSLILGSGTGIVSADGNIFTMVDYDVSDNALFLWVGIKKSSGDDNGSDDSSEGDGSDDDSSACFISTGAFGSKVESHIKPLRDF
ncbi:MAG: hypothetical protein SVY10_12080 [Thermodesulfobacteriota bacterium]|nr:hypothetical protein [Thermodesulfobacteriota bacterium]